MRLIDADKLDYMLKLARVSTSTSITDEGLKLALSFIKDIPTVKAIPIEWIVNKWAKKFWKVINDKKYYTGDGYDTVWDMIEDWEKENGK